MYSRRIEELIDAALADGVLTEKEKKVLFKNAKAEGIDLDEFEMILDAKVLRTQQTKQPILQAKEKRGNIIVCPNCGANVSAIAGTCPECGHEFTGAKANSSAQVSASKIEKISNETENLEERWNKMASIINAFPIPNTKADLFEFAAAMHSKMNETIGGDHDTRVAGTMLMTAYLNKYKECITKIQALYSSEPLFAELLKTSKKDIKHTQETIKCQRAKKTNWGEFGIIVLLIIVVALHYWIYKNDDFEWWEKMLYGGASLVGGTILFCPLVFIATVFYDD